MGKWFLWCAVHALIEGFQIPERHYSGKDSNMYWQTIKFQGVKIQDTVNMLNMLFESCQAVQRLFSRQLFIVFLQTLGQC